MSQNTAVVIGGIGGAMEWHHLGSASAARGSACKRTRGAVMFAGRA
jgi:hypothetical protein